LLYKFERPQFKQISEEHKDPLVCEIYGAEHLLRLFVKLPELLAHTKLSPQEASVMQGKLQEFLRWFDKKTAYFSAEYTSASADYVKLAKPTTAAASAAAP